MTQIINCLIVDDERIACEIIESYLKKIANVNIVGMCYNSIEALDLINSKEVDLVFMDIHMPELSGLSLAKLVGDHTKIIFTTAYREYALNGFELKAIDYLLKPISFERFIQAINTYKERVLTVPTEQAKSADNSLSNEFIYVRSERKMVRVNFNEVLYIESLSDYLKINCEDKEIITRETISNIEEKLPSWFVRIHRSFIIPLRKIDSYTHELVEIKGKELPISRNYRDSVLEQIKIPSRTNE